MIHECRHETPSPIRLGLLMLGLMRMPRAVGYPVRCTPPSLQSRANRKSTYSRSTHADLLDNTHHKQEGTEWPACAQSQPGIRMATAQRLPEARLADREALHLTVG